MWISNVRAFAEKRKKNYSTRDVNSIRERRVEGYFFFPANNCIKIQMCDLSWFKKEGKYLMWRYKKTRGVMLRAIFFKESATCTCCQSYITTRQIICLKNNYVEVVEEKDSLCLDLYIIENLWNWLTGMVMLIGNR
jgi:hypothetical protein